MTYADLKKYIIENNKITYILENLGMGHINDSNPKYISCSMPNGDNPQSTIIYKDEYLTTLAYTRKIKTDEDGKKPNLFNLIMYINKCEFSTAVSWCSALLGISTDKSFSKNNKHMDFFKKIKKKNEMVNNQVYYDRSILDVYGNMPHIDLVKQDSIISQSIIEKYNILFDYRSDRIVFPHFKYDDANIIAGVVGRTTIKAYKELGIKKYMSLLDTDFKKTLNLYALSHNVENIKREGIVFIFEAEKSVIKADMYGFPCGVAVGCHEISQFQRKLLIGLNVEICIAFDNDVEEEHVLNICQQLSKYRNVSYIKDRWSFLKEKDSPVDKGYKKWRYLVKNRVKITDGGEING